MTTLQTVLMFILITFVFIMLISMGLLTWALIRPKATISWRKAGVMIMGSLASAFLCYTLLIMTK
jgi:hypothetical protein